MTAPRYPGSVAPPTVSVRPMGIGTRARMRVRHTGRLGREVARYGAQQGAWWLIPVVTIMVLFAAAITTTTTALPVAVYTLF